MLTVLPTPPAHLGNAHHFRSGDMIKLKYDRISLTAVYARVKPVKICHFCIKYIVRYPPTLPCFLQVIFLVLGVVAFIVNGMAEPAISRPGSALLVFEREFR